MSRPCKQCGKEFERYNTMQKTCSIKCAIEYVKEKEKKEKKKKFNAQTRKMKAEIKTKNDWTKEAQAEFNSYIRARDHKLPCISCGRHHKGQYHAGHFLTRAAHPELKFNTLNCHKQCSPCNNKLSGNVIEYRKNLIEKIGLENVEWLEGPHELQSFSIEDLAGIKKLFKSLAKYQTNKNSETVFQNWMSGLEDN